MNMNMPNFHGYYPWGALDPDLSKIILQNQSKYLASNCNLVNSRLCMRSWGPSPTTINKIATVVGSQS